MQLKSDPHIFSGMQRDMSISKQKAESLYDAKNLRFTARDGDTMLSITNEKGTSKVVTTLRIEGDYLGHCVVDDYVVLFTHRTDGEDTPDHIYKITNLGDTTADVVSLYEGNLNFSAPIETLGVYENDNIQKVYWTDGINQPRMIFTGSYNHIQPNDANHPNSDFQFDFVPTLKLDEDVAIERSEGSGMFAPGVIQYAFSYYNKYGRQSNIFFTSLLHYISYPDRGGNPEDKVANCFKITISNLQTVDFDYLRIYSIHRTSLNAVPTVKRVTDLELALIDNNKITFIDNGMVGDTMDPTELLYLGGETLYAQTLTQKDNTLFLGNLELARPSIPSTYKNILNAYTKSQQQIETLLNPQEVLCDYALTKYDTANDYYQYANSLNWSVPGFKNREHYRLGVQFQHNTGKWSEPVFIGDYTFEGNVNPRLDMTDTSVTLYTVGLDITIPTTYIDNGVTRSLLEDGYMKIRPVVVFPTLEDRLVLTQGILSPTVFSRFNRENSSPFVQSSWFFRPSLPKASSPDINCIPNRLDGHVGTYIAYRHLESLAGAELSNNGNPNLRAVEIQGSMYPIDEKRENGNITISPTPIPKDKDFFVDQSIVTMHSPDIEWDEDFNLLNYTDWKLRIVGASIIDSVCSDIDIQVSTPQNLDATGFIKSRYNVADSWLAGGCLASILGWEDYLVSTSFKDNTTKYYMFGTGLDGSSNFTDNSKKVKYIVYPWNRSGSLNNDENRGDNGTRSAVLKTKKLSNLKYCKDNLFFSYSANDSFDGTLDITQIQMFDFDQVSLVKLPLKNKVFKDANVSYYGNVDTLLSGNTADILVTEGNSIDMARSIVSTYVQSPIPSKKDGIIYSGDTPVRMKYKSGKHLVFGLQPNEDRSTNILPRVSGVPDDSSNGGLRQYNINTMFWVNDTYNKTDTYNAIVVDVMVFDNLTSAQSLTSYAYSIKDGDLIVLLTGGTTDDANINYPILARASTLNGVLNSVSSVPTEAGKYYVGVYYKSAKDCDEQCIYTKDTTSNVEYALKVDSFESLIEETSNVEEGQPMYPFRVNQKVIPNSSLTGTNQINRVANAYFLLGELYKENPISWDDTEYPYFGGKTDEVTKSNLWIPAGEAVKLSTNESNVVVHFTQGDTWYTRYDCLKTYPFTQEDENQIIEIASFLCESRINGDGRYDRNRGQMSNINMSPINFNLLNPVYSNKDNFFNYRILDEDYYNINRFSNQITWSKEKANAADIDLWTNITMANTFDLDGTMGPIEALRTWQDIIYCFQDNAISVISFNPRVQIPTNDGVPIEVSNSYKLEGKYYISDSIGCKNKQTIAVTPSGLYFIDPNSKEFFHLAGKELSSVSTTHGFSNWFKNNELTHTFYDKNRNDVYVLNDTDCIVYSELLGQFTSFMDYYNIPTMFNVNDRFYAFKDSDKGLGLYSLFTGEYNYFFNDYKPYWLEFISNADSSIDKTFSTIETRVDFRELSNNEWQVVHNEFFDTLQAENEYQKGIKNLSKSITASRADAKKKFRVWRVVIPRDTAYPLHRIRNTWAKIKFTKDPRKNQRMELHDVNVQYFI